MISSIINMTLDLAFDEAQNAQGECTAEHVHGYLLVGPMEHGGHRDVAVVLELTKACLDFPPGPICGDDFSRPVRSVDDEKELCRRSPLRVLIWRRGDGAPSC
jgi:hypothetical protein